MSHMSSSSRGETKVDLTFPSIRISNADENRDMPERILWLEESIKIYNNRFYNWKCRDHRNYEGHTRRVVSLDTAKNDIGGVESLDTMMVDIDGVKNLFNAKNIGGLDSVETAQDKIGGLDSSKIFTAVQRL